MKIFLIIVGIISLRFGFLGAILPLLPAFPFLVLSAFCFSRSSKKLNTWFLGTKLYKNNLESFVSGKGMTVKTKVKVMITVTVIMTISFIMMNAIVIGRIVLACVWVFHIIYFLFFIKTIKVES